LNLQNNICQSIQLSFVNFDCGFVNFTFVDGNHLDYVIYRRHIKKRRNLQLRSMTIPGFIPELRIT